MTERRKGFYKIVLDTETCPIDNSLEGVTPSNMLVYDIGWAIVDKFGTVYETRSYINTDVFIDETEKMQSAYYSDKVPKYWEDVNNHTRTLARMFTIRKKLLKDIKEYKVKEIYAHNARFDDGALNKTIRYLTNDRYRYFIPKDITVCDTLKMSRDVVVKTPTYIKFCEENDFLTKNGIPRATAEILYRYITKDIDFVENHTGLEDVLIEKEIMRYCYAKHKKMRKKLYE